MQDDQLRQMAILVNSHHLQVSSATQAAMASEVDPEARVILQALQPQPLLASTSNPMRLDLKSSLPNGIQTVSANDETWRILVKPLDSGVRIAIGQRTSVRNEIARNSALRTVLPFFVLIPVLLLLVNVLISRMFKPMTQLALDLDHSDGQGLQALNFDHVPTEVHPFVVAINRLLARVAQSMALQRRFLADAAHELRSPLTALSLQSERLAATELSEQARERVDALQSGLQRSRQLLDQLLALARAQDSDKLSAGVVSVRRVCHRVLEDLMPLALAKEIDLGMVLHETGSDALVSAQDIDVYIMTKNLVDNAIRYTPRGGQVDVSIGERDGNTELQVADSGPGISEEHRQRVFDPFYRVIGNDEIGSGLGLSIVKTIADRLGANVTLDFATKLDQSGLLVTVAFPHAPTSAP
ncbi:ATP-binding protein [Rhodoferax sp.]|uniref:ATP-binding protein n=1 Tax=Rhodoferax sp. TaxID=50421 RepID=UPI00285284DC|nr:ATP-binding protein [Rhodoferax sp.]